MYTRFYIIFIIVFSQLNLWAGPDTLRAYKMGGIEFIDGLSYGSEHSIVFYTDSTYVYHVEYANQISTSDMVHSSGKWKQVNDTLNLYETQRNNPPDARFFNSIRNEFRSNSLISFRMGECIACSDINEATVYYRDSAITIPVYLIQEVFSDVKRKLKYPVPYLKTNIEVGVPSIDSVRICGMVAVAEKPNLNEIGLYVNVPFSMRFRLKGDQLQIASSSLRRVYVFRRIK